MSRPYFKDEHTARSENWCQAKKEIVRLGLPSVGFPIVYQAVFDTVPA